VAAVSLHELTTVLPPTAESARVDGFDVLCQALPVIAALLASRAMARMRRTA
jgi:hypothetical protein